MNLDLLDSEGHTVLDLLAEYPADKAREIQRMIEGELGLEGGMIRIEHAIEKLL